MSQTDVRYSAFAARDVRFDGVFFIGVTSTGIYCRPVCTAKTPRAANCRFFENAESAEKANFRPCLRCRPELAPGTAPVDDARRVAALFAHRIAEGQTRVGHEREETTSGVEGLAAQFGWSARQIRRIVRKELGVSPMELILTRRLLLAKQLLTDTTLPIGEVAFASGFSSLRRFNSAFSGRYRMPPTRFRKSLDRDPVGATDVITLRLSYRPPFDWTGLLRFLDARAMKGVESVCGESYARTVRLGVHQGWIVVRHAPDVRALILEISHSLTPVLPALLGRVRHLFDLSARPDIIAGHLASDPQLSTLVANNPGLRVPGAFDGFEVAVRAVLGQQITVKGATTLAGRVTEGYGERITTPHEGLTHLAPTAEGIACASSSALSAMGIVSSRADCIASLAREVVSGRLQLEAGLHPARSMEQLESLRGIGPWTAQYIAMRALRWPDAFPKEDVVLRKQLGGLTAREAERRAEGWRPWRSYATLHLWQSAARSGDPL